jgi:hypothetical protein
MPKIWLVGVFAVWLSTDAPAQWLNYPTPEIPRTPDGKANLSAPAPRTSECGEGRVREAMTAMSPET